MIRNNNKVKNLIISALIGALYVALTMFLAPISYGPLQLRISEALTVLPYLFPQAILGLFVGCMIANLSSPFGLIDITLGSVSTLIAAYLTSKAPKPILAPVPPILVNSLIISSYISYFTKIPYLLIAFYILVSQTLVLYGIGYPLLLILLKRKEFHKYPFQ